MLEVKNLSFGYKNKLVLENVSFCCKEKEITSYLGTNGSGKTTTFKIITGLLNSQDGSVLFKGNRITQKDISYLNETRSLFYDARVYQQLKLICDLNKIIDYQNRIYSWCQRLKIEPYLNHKIDSLSKGNQQKVALACCLIKDCPIYVFDEPFSGLDSNNGEIFIEIIEQLKQQDKIILLSCHQYQAINEIADHYIVLKNGNIQLDISKQQLLERKERVVVINEIVNIEPKYYEKEYFLAGKYHYIVKDDKSGKKLLNYLLKENINDFRYSHLSFDDIYKGEL